MVDLFTRIGGMSVIEKLVDDFYQAMQTDPRARDCLKTHEGKDIKESALKLKYFLAGWLGGPPLFLQNIGPPRLRMRHFPFSIGENEARQWLFCMEEALNKSSIDKDIQKHMMGSFAELTKIIRNRP